MTAFVLDASLALAWSFKDEVTAQTDSLLDRTHNRGACVPQLWWLEVSNVLLQANRRARLSDAGLAETLSLLEALELETDEATGKRAFGETLALAKTHGLTTYDAAYLELAIRRRLPLATLDAALQRAAQSCGIPLAIQPT